MARFFPALSKARIRGVAIVMIAGLGGVYFLLTVSALWSGNPGPWDSMQDIHYDSALQHRIDGAERGQTVALPVLGSFSRNSEERPWKIFMHFRSDSNRTQYMGFTCGSVASCKSSSWVPALNTDGDPLPGRSDLSICMDVPAHVPLKTPLTFITLKYKLLKSGSFRLVEDYGFAKGTCAQDSRALGLRSPYGNNACYNRLAETQPYVDDTHGCGGRMGDAEGKGPPQPHQDPDGKEGKDRGPDGEGDGLGKDTGDGSGGGGGSSAKKQNDTPSPLSSYSPQGDSEKQPELEPSPFFDGQSFTRGSDPDNLASTVAATGRTLANNWPLALGLLAVVSLVGIGWWFWWRKSH